MRPANRILLTTLISILSLLMLLSCGQQAEVSPERMQLLMDTLRTDLEYGDWYDFAWELSTNYPQEQVAGMILVQGMEKAILEQDAKGYRNWFEYLSEYPEGGIFTTSDRIAIADRSAWAMLENMLLLDEVPATNEFAINLFEANKENLQWRNEIGASIYDTRGRLLVNSEKRAEALEAYNLALSYAETPDILVNRAMLLEEEGDLAGALEDFIAALRLTPDEPMLFERVKQLFVEVEPGEDADAFLADLMASFHEQRREEVLGEMFSLPAPDYSFTANTGKVISKANTRNKVVLVDFWATWCQPCRRELPEYQKLYDKYIKNDRVVFIAASTDREKEKVKPYIESNGYRFPYAHDEGQAGNFGVEGIPSLFIIGPDGNIRYKIVGFDPDHDFVEEMSWRIESLL